MQQLVQEALQKGAQLHQQGLLAEAETLYRKILETTPGHPDANHRLGMIERQAGRNEQAIEWFSRAIQANPDVAAYHGNLGNAFRDLGRLEDAVASYRKALTIQPDFAEAHSNLGSTLNELGRLDEAVASYHKALAIKPDYPVAHSNLGNALHCLERLDEAVASYHKALAIKPDLAEAHSNLGNVLLDLGRLDEAVASYRKALTIQPDYAEAHSNLGNVLLDLGRLDEAVASYRKALTIQPDFAEAHSNLGNVLQSLGRLEDAVASCQKAIAIQPDYAEGHCNLGSTLKELGRLDEALASYHKALAIKPDYPMAHSNLGNVLQDLGRLDEAVASYRKALAIKPDFVEAHSNLLVTMPFMSCFDGAAVFAAACRAGTVFESPFADRLTIRHANTPDQERRLRVGYLLSSNTTLAKNIEPVFKAHRRDRVSVHVYAHVANPDDVTWRLKELADSWVFVHGLSDDQLAARIAGDGIDILVDPVGHWAGNRLVVFARKPAPIQVSYLSQGLTTGLSAMDYTISDRWLNFNGAMQSFATEQVVELPSGFEVKVLDWDLPVGEAPSTANGFITFSSFNNPAKISDASLRLWAAVLAPLPTARLLIKGKWLDQPKKRALLSKRLTDHGIPAERTDFRGFVPGPDHLAVHNLADIALDTIPFAGGQTTIDALWMGVPVVTLIGDTACGRYGYSHLNRIGHPELAARSEAEFVEIALALTGDPDRLRNYRQTLRPALRASSLVDASLHVAELEEAYRVMWRRWCDGLEPQAFTGFDKSGP